MSKNKIVPTVILTIDTKNIYNIPIVITNILGEILVMTSVPKFTKQHIIRKNFVEKLDKLIKEYSVDTIIIEQNKLFIDKIDRYPDPYVLQNVLLDYSLKVIIEDKYWETIKYIIELPQKEWQETILNRYTKYAIDLYKSHILQRDLDNNTLKIIDENNYYRSLCLSESSLYDSLMKKKYQINR